jgi:hypothetical protein
MSGLLSDVGGFAKGFGQGLWGGAKGMVQGLGSLAEGAYDIATDPNARAQAWNDAVNAAQTVEWAAQNPGQAASAIGQGATNLYGNFVTAEQQAEANGQGAQFWGNAAGQVTFAAGTVLVPGLVEGKLAGAAGELGDASQLVKAATTVEDAAPAVADAAGTAEGTAGAADAAAATPALPDPDALSFVPENSGVAQSPAGQAWRDYQAQTVGSDMDPLTGQSNVPALDFDNPNPNGNPFVKWDGYQTLPDGTSELIDAKTAISPFSTSDGPFVPQSTLDQLVNKSAALDQNPGYSGVIEVPTTQAAADAQAALDGLGIGNIDVRVRPFQDAASPASGVAADGGPVVDPAAASQVGSDAAAAPVGEPDPALGTAALGTAGPAASDATSLPNAGNLLGAGLLGAGAMGNALSPSPSPAASTPSTQPATADIAPDTTCVGTLPLYSATYGVNPDGSLTTLSPPALVSPGDTSITPPQPIVADPVDTPPVDDPDSVVPDPDSMVPDPTIVAPASTPPAADDSAIDPSDDFSAIDSGGGGGGGGGVDEMAEMDAD